MHDSRRRLTLGLIIACFLQAIPMTILAFAGEEVPTVMYSWDMSVDPEWEMEGEWEYGIPTGEGGDSFGLPDPTSGATGDYVLGINNQGDFSMELGGPYYLTSPVLDCSQSTGTTLRFMRWLNMDWQPYVLSYIEVSKNGSEWTAIWENDCCAEITESEWSQHEFDISSVADGEYAVQVRWSYQINTGVWAYSGWNLDDIEVLGVIDTSEECIGDINGDSEVDGADLTVLLGTWGICDGTAPCIADLNRDDVVDGVDLALLLSGWGPC